MRKEAKHSNNVDIQTIQGYHHSRFNTLKVFASDRAKKVESYGELNIIGLKEKLIGLECENEFDRNTNEAIMAEILQKVVFSHFPDDFFRIEYDGSLTNGCECITQTGTKAFFRNQYKNFKTMFDDYFPTMGISSYRTGHCGMHTNLSLANFGKTKKDQDEAIKKMHYVINNYFDFWCAMLNRKTNHTGYCGRMRYDNVKNEGFIDSLADWNNHNACINYGHYRQGRIELRLVGGQGSFEQFKNTMETVFFLIDRVKTIGWNDIDNKAKFFKGCNQYVFDRLSTIALRRGTITPEEVEEIRENIKAEEW